MPNQKQKTESYSNLGGINVKASPYITGEMQFLDISNLDFQTPGALTKRWGSTQYMGMPLTDGSANIIPIQGFFEYNKLNGLSRIVVMGGSNGYYLDGTSFTSFRSQYTAGISNFDGSSIGIQTQVLQATAPWAFLSFADQLFFANGKNFVRFDGNSSYIYGVPNVESRDGLGIIARIPGSSGVAVSSGGMTGSFFYKFGYVNNRGYIGVVPYATIFSNGNADGVPFAWHAQVTTQGTTQVIIDMSQGSLPLKWFGHGITAIAVYRTDPLPVSINTNAANIAARSAAYNFLTIIPFGSSLFIDTNIQAGITSAITYLNHQSVFYSSYSSGGSLVSASETFVPKYLETYRGRMIMSGFSYALSSFWFSELNEPEGVMIESKEDVKLNDGDRITGQKAYGDKCYFFKLNSFHAYLGANSVQFFSQDLSEVSSQYGCLSNRAICVYNDIMLFLDRKGVVRYNGSTPEIISSPVQDYFDRMNVSAAIDNAVMIHDKSRKQILVGIPWNGSSTLNLTLVYDYLVNAWTRYEGMHINQYVIAQGRLSEKTLMVSDNSGLVHNFGPSFFSENKIGYTCYFKTRFVHDLGQSVEKQFRRLYMNFSQVSGSSMGVTIGFFVNYGTSIQIQRTLPVAPFQSRTDFGLSSKSLAFECAALNASLPYQVTGFALDYRYQRGV